VTQTLRDPAKQDMTNLFLGKYFSRRVPPLTRAMTDDVIRVKAYKTSTWKVPASEYGKQ
jgi:hypothetical protein